MHSKFLLRVILISLLLVGERGKCYVLKTASCNSDTNEIIILPETTSFGEPFL